MIGRFSLVLFIFFTISFFVTPDMFGRWDGYLLVGSATVFIGFGGPIE